MKVAVGYPWSLEFSYTGFTETALNLRRPVGHDVRFFRGTGWCSARRHNHILEQALSWGADLICIIGADQDYPDEAMLEKMIGRIQGGCGAVCALVPMRGFSQKQGDKPFQLVGWRLKADAPELVQSTGRLGIEHFEPITREQHGDLVQIHAAGTGAIMFPASALVKMPRPWFIELPSYPGFERSACADTPFITRLQTHAGLDLWCDTTIEVGHLHVFRIDRTFSKRFADWEFGGGDPAICSYVSNPAALPSVSVVIPCHNAQYTIARAIQSALSQSVSPKEIIVVDDGSTDASAAIAENLGVKVIRQANAGPSAARNAGIAVATGDFILPLDADDYLDPRCIEVMMQKAAASGADIVASAFRMFGETDDEVRPPESVTIDSFLARNPIGCCSAVRRAKVLEVGGYNPNMVWSWEDYDLWVNIVKRGGKVATVDTVLWHYRNSLDSRNAKALEHGDELLARLTANHPDVPFDLTARRWFHEAQNADGGVPCSAI